MQHIEFALQLLGLIIIAAPLFSFVALGLASLIDHAFDERTVARIVQAGVMTGLGAALIVLVSMLCLGNRHISIDLGEWVHVPEYHFAVKFLIDRLSVPFVMLSFILCGTVGAFANRYMHREKGFNRFFLLLALFLLGMVLTSMAGNIETLFTGWELVGLSSTLLVAFFHDRPAPVRNALRVWCVYRVSDAALLVGSVVMHHLTGAGDFDALVGIDPWPAGVATLTQSQALLVGSLMIVAAAGKSALVPFSNWLPRAMEGPTPSSAVFYGALSVHLGAFLLLRISPILNETIWLRAAVVLIGLLTAAYAAFAGRVQTDIKCALCFASLSQVGLIVAEIGFGLRYLALIHIIGHACLRMLQFLRAPTLLHDYHMMENAIGARLLQKPGNWDKRIPEHLRTWLYRLALEKGYLDAWLSDYIVAPVLGVFRWCDSMERRWTDFLAGGKSRESEELKPASTGPLEELL